MSAMLREASLVAPTVEPEAPIAANAKGSNALLAAQGSPPPAPPGDGITPEARAAGIQNGTRREVYAAHRDTIANTSFDLSKFGYATDRFTKIWTENRERYERVAAATGVPAELIAALHFRESSGNFNTYLHNGQPLGQRTTIVPKGILFYDWEEAAIDALRSQDAVRKDLNMTAETQDLAAIATYGEYYNGLGYHNRGKESPYVYSGSDAYTSGKYVADGKYDPNTRDQQLGVLAMVQLARGQIDKSGKPTDAPQSDGPSPGPGARPVRPGRPGRRPPRSQARTEGDAAAGSIDMGARMLSLGDFGRDVTALQRALNRLGYPIAIDGEFGPQTDHAVRGFQRGHGLEVDGVIGPASRAVIQDELTGSGRTPPPGPDRGPTAGPPPGSQTGPSEDKDQPEGTPGPGPDTTTEAKLAQFFEAFNGIPIRVNPGEETPRYVDVIPPYHINAGFRKDGAARERAGNRAVNEVIQSLPVNARYGKATHTDIQNFLDTCIRRGLVPDTSARGMRDFLARYGISTDCSGLVSQALNFLADGNMQIDRTDPFDPLMTGSESLKGGSGAFDAVRSPRELTAGVTMHIPGHIRILLEVDRQGQAVVFRTAESTPREDVVDPDQRDAAGVARADGGIGDVHWRYPGADRFDGLQRSSDGGRTWANSSERPTFGRWRRLSA